MDVDLSTRIADTETASASLKYRVTGATNGTATALDDVVLSAVGAEPRTDLAVIRLDADKRRLQLHLIEVKVRSQLGEGKGIPVTVIDDQGEEHLTILPTGSRAIVTDGQAAAAGIIEIQAAAQAATVTKLAGPAPTVAQEAAARPAGWQVRFDRAGTADSAMNSALNASAINRAIATA